MSRLIVLSVLLLTACGGTEPGLEAVSVTGTLTNGGQPATGSGVALLGLTGETDPVATVFADFDGSYGVAGEVDSSDCGRVFVSVRLVNPFGQTIGEATESVGSCGTHEIDLVLTP